MTAPRQFPSRELRSGWVGEESAEQPKVADRLRSLIARDTATSFEYAERITRIDHNNGATTYHLANRITIVAPQGARIYWETQNEPS